MAKRANASGEAKYPPGFFTDKDAEENKEWITDAFERLSNGESLSRQDNQKGRLLFHDIADVRGETEMLEKARFLYSQVNMDDETTEASPSDKKERSWETAIIQALGRSGDAGNCGRAFTKRDCVKHKKLLDKAKKLFDNFDEETLVDDRLVQDLFKIFRGVGEFTGIHAEASVTQAAQLYDLFFDKFVASSAKAAIRQAFDPAYVTLDDPLPASLAAAVAAYPPTGSPHGAPLPHNGSTRSWRCQSEVAAHHFLGFLQNQLGAGLHGWVFVCARNATRYN